MLLQTGQVIDGRFEILEALDKGGFGMVYTATDLHSKSKEIIAIKIVSH